MATYSNILAWRIPWTEEPGGLQSKESQRVKCNRVTEREREENRAICKVMNENIPNCKIYQL